MENCRHTESLRGLPEYRDRSNIEKLSRDIDQLNFHASKVKTVMTIASGKKRKNVWVSTTRIV
jgi:hypothetical protein